MTILSLIMLTCDGWREEEKEKKERNGWKPKLGIKERKRMESVQLSVHDVNRTLKLRCFFSLPSFLSSFSLYFLSSTIHSQVITSSILIHLLTFFLSALSIPSPSLTHSSLSLFLPLTCLPVNI